MSRDFGDPSNTECRIEPWLEDDLTLANFHSITEAVKEALQQSAKHHQPIDIILRFVEIKIASVAAGRLHTKSRLINAHRESAHNDYLQQLSATSDLQKKERIEMKLHQYESKMNAILSVLYRLQEHINAHKQTL